MSCLEVLEDVFGVRNFVRVGLGVLDEGSLDEDLLHLHVVENTGVSPGALAESTVLHPRAAHAHSTGEESSAVRDKLHFLEVTRIERVRSISSLLSKSLVKSPLSHDEGVIDGEAVDLIDTAGLDLIVVLLIPRKLE